MKTKLFCTLFFLFVSTIIHAQIQSAQLTPFLKNYILIDTSGPGLLQDAGDILLQLAGTEQDENENLVILRKSKNKLIQIAENANLLMSKDMLGASGSNYTSLFNNELSISYTLGSNSAQSSISIVFEKNIEGDYLFKEYTSSTKNYGVENLNASILITAEQTGIINFSDATEEMIIEKRGKKEANSMNEDLPASKSYSTEIIHSNTLIRDSNPPNIEILLPAFYRKTDDYPDNLTTTNWHELYYDENKHSWKTAVADLKMVCIMDECTGDSAINISTDRDALLLLSGFDNLMESPVTAMTDKFLFPGHSLLFSLNKKIYNLLPTGNYVNEKGVTIPLNEINNKTENELADDMITSYSLALREDGKEPFNIIQLKILEYTSPRLLWAGDINRDGFPDLILDLPEYTESRGVYLFLSDIKDIEKPLKMVAYRLVVSDC